MPGGRFVSVALGGELDNSALALRREIILVQHWFEELRRLVPTD